VMQIWLFWYVIPFRLVKMFTSIYGVTYHNYRFLFFRPGKIETLSSKFCNRAEFDRPAFTWPSARASWLSNGGKSPRFLAAFRAFITGKMFRC
jgi:hypothetical protein